MRTAILSALLLIGTSAAFAGGPRVSIGVQFGGPSYGSGYYGPGPGYYYAPPPPPRRVIVPRSPGLGYVWVGGYWYPSGRNYSWRDGYWTQPPHRGARWVSPYYRNNRYYNGYWR